MHVSEVTVSNVNDWDEQLTMESHLGDRLREGDIVEGYDLRQLSILDNFKIKQMPDVILVKKQKEKNEVKDEKKKEKKERINRENKEM